MNEAAYHAILRRLGVEPEGTAAQPLGGPTHDPELTRRVAAFRTQLAAWTGAGVPLLTLPDAPEPRMGRCVSCGKEISEGWRCALCLHAVHLALGMTPAEET